LFGVAVGGAAAARIAEQFHWRASFWALGGTGLVYAIPMWLFLRSMPAALNPDASAGKPASLRDFFSLFRIPSLSLLTGFVAIATFSIFLVYSWLPAFLSDKFALGLARAGFEASVYPQIGNAFGLLLGGWAADRYYTRTKASRFLVASAGLVFGAPAIYFVGAAPTLELTRVAAIVFGFCHGFIASNQVACAYEVVPAALRSSTIGILNLVGGVVSGMAPYLGGLSRGTIGIDRLMGFTALLMMLAAGLLLYAAAAHLTRDREAAEAAGW
jgi:predicted MFS family arabinose efflux permease